MWKLKWDSRGANHRPLSKWVYKSMLIGPQSFGNGWRSELSLVSMNYTTLMWTNQSEMSSHVLVSGMRIADWWLTSQLDDQLISRWGSLCPQESLPWYDIIGWSVSGREYSLQVLCGSVGILQTELGFLRMAPRIRIRCCIFLVRDSYLTWRSLRACTGKLWRSFVHSPYQGC